ncbi:lipopolysaccharide kinase InaA family protein [Myxococcota bacterium]|nr:lipopolysaccharide kinase InaA family protein [Myxococcota bacterium]
MHAIDQHPSFLRVERGPLIAWLDREFQDALEAARLLEPGVIQSLLKKGEGPIGRAATAIVPLNGPGVRLHLRGMRHGGWLGPLFGGIWPSPKRGRTELQLTATLADRGLPVPRPVLTCGERVAPGCYRVSIATLHIDHGCDGLEWLSSIDPPHQLSRIAPAARSAGRTVRDLHDAGAIHGDLHLGNLVFREKCGDLQTIAVDFDRARLVPIVDARDRTSELMRLYRSLVKRRLPSDLIRAALGEFLEAYLAGDDGLGQQILARVPRERLHLARHRILYAVRRHGEPS